jgi:hypothetical protein
MGNSTSVNSTDGILENGESAAKKVKQSHSNHIHEQSEIERMESLDSHQLSVSPREDKNLASRDVEDQCENVASRDGEDQRENAAPQDVEDQCAISNTMEMGCDMECTICMEPISEGTILPCQCKLHYCLPCWDKALANSFSHRGQATCPSCRTLVRVDFDVKKQCLVFSTEDVDMTFAAQKEIGQKVYQEFAQQKPGASQGEFHDFLKGHKDFDLLSGKLRQDIIERLRHQAMPVQVNLLHQFGNANPSLLDIHANARETLAKSSVAEMKAFMKAACVDGSGCLEKSDLITCLMEKTDAARFGSMWASQKFSAPKCVCGCSLRRVTGFERFKMMSDDWGALSDDEVEHMLHRAQQRKLVCCDICEADVPLRRNSFVWMCENRNSSILHATSYDICEKCFVRCACS